MSLERNLETMPVRTVAIAPTRSNNRRAKEAKAQLFETAIVTFSASSVLKNFLSTQTGNSKQEKKNKQEKAEKKKSSRRRSTESLWVQAPRKRFFIEPRAKRKKEETTSSFTRNYKTRAFSLFRLGFALTNEPSYLTVSNCLSLPFFKSRAV